MKFKLDENLGHFGEDLFRQAGFDVESVFSEGLCSSPDTVLIRFCQEEGRCLVTLDLDFSNPLVFDPKLFSGIAVLRLPKRLSRQDILDAMKTLILGIQKSEITGRLWIISSGQIREYQHPDLDF